MKFNQALKNLRRNSNIFHKYKTNFFSKLKSNPGQLSLKTNTKKICFEINIPEVESVALTGSFNDWNAEGIPLKKNWRGVWRAYLQLNPGKYEYKYIINRDTWISDPANPDKSINSFGTDNSIRIIT